MPPRSAKSSEQLGLTLHAKYFDAATQDELPAQVVQYAPGKISDKCKAIAEDVARALTQLRERHSQQLKSAFDSAQLQQQRELEKQSALNEEHSKLFVSLPNRVASDTVEVKSAKSFTTPTASHNLSLSAASEAHSRSRFSSTAEAQEQFVPISPLSASTAQTTPMAKPREIVAVSEDVDSDALQLAAEMEQTRSMLLLAQDSAEHLKLVIAGAETPSKARMDSNQFMDAEMQLRAKLSESNTALQRALALAQQTEQALQLQLASCERELAELRGKLSRSELTNNALEQAKSELQESIQVLKKQLSVRDGMVVDLEQQLGRTTLQQSAQSATTVTTRTLLEQSLAELRLQLSTRDAEVKSLQQQLSSTTQSAADAKQSLSDIERARSEASQLVVALKEQLAGRESELISIKQTHATALADSKRTVHQLEQQVAALDEQISSLQSKLRTAESSVHSAEQSRNMVQASLEQLKQQASAREGLLSEQQQSRSKLESALQQATQELKKREGQVAELQQKLSMSSQALQQTSKSSEQFQQTISDLTQRLSSREAQVAALETKLASQVVSVDLAQVHKQMPDVPTAQVTTTTPDRRKVAVAEHVAQRPLADSVTPPRRHSTQSDDDSSLKRQLHETTELLQSTTVESERVQSQLNTVLTSLRSKSSAEQIEWSERLSALEQKCANLEQSLQTATKQLSVREAENESLQSSVKEVEQARIALQQQFAEMNFKLDEREMQIAQLQAELNSRASSEVFEQLKEAHDRSLAEVASLKQQSGAAQSDLQITISDLQQAVSRRDAALQQQLEKLQQLQATHDTALREIVTLKQQSDNDQLEISHLRLAVKESESALARESDSLQHVTIARDAALSELASVRQQLLADSARADSQRSASDNVSVACVEAVEVGAPAPKTRSADNEVSLLERSLADMKQQLSDRENEIGQWQQRVTELNASFGQQLQQRDAAVDRLRHQLSDSQRSHDELTPVPHRVTTDTARAFGTDSETMELQRRICESMRASAESTAILQRDVVSLQQSRDELAEQLSVVQEQLLVSQQQLSKSTAALDNVTAQAEQLEQDVQYFQEQLAVRDMETTGLRVQLAELQAINDAKQSVNRVLEVQHDAQPALESVADADDGENHASLLQLNATIEHLELEVHKSRERWEQQQRELNDGQAARDLLQQAKAELLQQLAAKDSHIEELQQKLVVQESADTQSDAQRLRSSLHELEQQLDVRDTEIQTLRDQVSQCQFAVQQANVSAESAVVDLQQKLWDRDTQLSDMRQRLMAATAQQQSLEQTGQARNQLQQELADLQIVASSRDQDIAELQHKLTECEAMYQKTLSEFTLLQRQFAELQVERDECVDEKDNLEEENRIVMTHREQQWQLEKQELLRSVKQLHAQLNYVYECFVAVAASPPERGDLQI
eukprot:TRINITY_DN12035_c0_g1_i2.p1 TRINITY_DN12035_c0_g1~~TRINITY_DN12035_c0_g1_i2.p1  ORF type:complete len:1414 (-),score=491.90 TRINITY_DN12035_c0_g1_i2:65-4306(-)